MTTPPASGHPDLDALSELDEGLLDDDAAARMRAHVDDCGTCRDQLTRLRTTRALLSTLPAVSMPEDVAARIDTALADAGQSGPTTVVPLGGKRRWRHAPTLAGAAASVAVVLLVAAVVTGRLSRHDHHSGEAATAGRPVPTTNAAAIKEWRTGTNYSAATLPALVPRLVTGTPPSPASVPSPTTTQQDKSAAAPGSYDRLLSSRSDVLDCARTLNDGTPVTPVAVDFAKFDGKPAVIFVLPTLGHPESLDVFAIRSVCSASSLDLYFRRLPRPAG